MHSARHSHVLNALRAGQGMGQMLSLSLSLSLSLALSPPARSALPTDAGQEGQRRCYVAKRDSLKADSFRKIPKPTRIVAGNSFTTVISSLGAVLKDESASSPSKTSPYPPSCPSGVCVPPDWRHQAARPLPKKVERLLAVDRLQGVLRF